MKKIISILTIVLSILSINAIAQSNLTWVMKEKGDKTYFQKTEFNCGISGLNNQKEATAFFNKIKENPDVASVSDKGKDAAGNYTMTIMMKSIQNKKYYFDWATKLGITTVMAVNGQKKTLQEAFTDNKKAHSEEAHTH